MNDSYLEVLQFVEENDVKFVRLAFCDLFGKQKNLSVPSAELKRIFEHGASFDGSAIDGFTTVDNSDLFLSPECMSMSILPWRPSQGQVMRMFCGVKNADGSDFSLDSRNLLKKAIERSAKMGYFCRVGIECEFYLFKTDDDGNPTKIPYDKGSYCDISPLDKSENIRREICLNLEQMGIKPESSHHERGKGQNEIDLYYSDALSAADNFMTFKWVAKSIATRHGAYASFMPKPILNECGNGLHINLSIAKGGKNLFKTSTTEHNQSSESFIAGILKRAREITAVLNPLTNSYSRLGEFEAPGYVTWSHQNRSQLIRIPAANGEYSRMELRSADPSCNPYLAFALLINAGLDGIEKNEKLTKPCNTNLFTAEEYINKNNIEKLPGNLKEALDIMSESEFVKNVMPRQMIDKYIELKNIEWLKINNVQNRRDYEMDVYFEEI